MHRRIVLTTALGAIACPTLIAGRPDGAGPIVSAAGGAADDEMFWSTVRRHFEPTLRADGRGTEDGGSAPAVARGGCGTADPWLQGWESDQTGVLRHVVRSGGLVSIRFASHACTSSSIHATECDVSFTRMGKLPSAWSS